MQDESTPIQVGPELEAELSALIGEGHTIAAIKRLREATGVNLGMATQIVAQRIDFKAQKERQPCPYCGKLLRSMIAKRCLECGLDWHDPNNVVRQGSRGR
jgi:hypothetical protein